MSAEARLRWLVRFGDERYLATQMTLEECIAEVEKADELMGLPPYVESE